MTTLFADSFETNDFSAETGTGLNGSGLTLSTQTGAAKVGTYGARVVATGAASQLNQAYAYKNITTSTTGITAVVLWHRWSAWTSSGITNGAAGGTALVILRGATGTVANDTSNVAWIELSNDNGAGPGYVGWYTSKSGTATRITGGSVVDVDATVGSWVAHKIVVDKSGTNPVITWATSTDGVAWTQQGQATDTTLGSVGVSLTPAAVQHGVAAIGNFDTINYTTEWDALSVYDADPTVADYAPTSDVSVGTWTTNTGGTTNLYQAVDESVADDTDYVRSVAAPTGSSPLTLAFPQMSNPGTTSGLSLKYRSALDAALAGGAVSLQVDLLQGGAALSTPATWTDAPGSATWALTTHALSTAQAGAINWGLPLQVKFTATQAAAATPALVGWGTAAWTASNNAAFTPTIANGSVGDLLLLFIVRNDTQAAPTVTGWTNIAALTGTNSTTESVAVYYKTATATTGSTDQVAVTFGTSTVARGGVVGRFSGVDTSSPIDQSSKLNVASTATTMSTTNVTSTVANTLAVFVALAIGARSTTNATTNWSAGSGVTAFASQNTTVGNDLTIGYASKFFASASSSYLTPGITWTTNTTTGVGISLLLGLKPFVNNNRAQVSYVDFQTPAPTKAPPPYQRKLTVWTRHQAA